MRTSLFLLLVACSGENPSSDGSSPDGEPTPTEWDCTLAGDAVGCDAETHVEVVGCREDFDALASLPLDASIPGARSIKTVVDQPYDDALYFMNSVRYPVHWDFASANLGAQQGFQPVPDLAGFNATEYYSPQRRFLLGAVTHYEEPDIWAYEIAPYDTASAEMVALAFNKIRDNAYFGQQLYYHPSSQAHENNVVPNLPADIPVISTDELFQGTAFQSYNQGTTTGLLRFYSADEVDGTYTPFRELVVLDAIPNDISITAGIITGEFQTPLAHINVLSINRGTPNMGLLNAHEHPDLVALEGKWVELTVDAFDWEIREITEAEAEAWWEENKPPPLGVPDIDPVTTDLRLVDDIIVDGNDLATEIDEKIQAFGSKGTNYAALVDIGQDVVPIQENAFVIPMAHYLRHMETHGLDDKLFAMMEEDGWADPAYRSEQLELLKADIVAAPIDPVLLQDVIDLADSLFPGENIRFRSSTNAEDLGTFTGAGIYNSATGKLDVPNPDEESVEWAIKTAWSNLWNTRAYEERDYYSIDQKAVGMALLTTANFPDEEANGVAITNNIFDTSGLEPGFYVNVQVEDFEVVQPMEGVLSDSYIHYWYSPGSPAVYISHSNLIPPGETVLSNQQVQDLGLALEAIHSWFMPVYGNDNEWYGMDTEFKFDDKYSPGEPQLFMKQARPFPWNPSSMGLSTCDEE